MSPRSTHTVHRLVTHLHSLRFSHHNKTKVRTRVKIKANTKARTKVKASSKLQQALVMVALVVKVVRAAKAATAVQRHPAQAQHLLLHLIPAHKQTAVTL
jgi:hypothetical protein